MSQRNSRPPDFVDCIIARRRGGRGRRKEEGRGKREGSIVASRFVGVWTMIGRAGRIPGLCDDSKEFFDELRLGSVEDSNQSEEAMEPPTDWQLRHGLRLLSR